MPPTRQSFRSLFHDVFGLTDPAERTALLDRRCGADGDLRRRLEFLLDTADRVAARSIEAPTGPGITAAPDVAGPDRLPDPSRSTVEVAGAEGESDASFVVASGSTVGSLIGTTIGGRYRIEREIGEGGMGTVYLAEQVAPVRRPVALKLIRAGMDSRQVLARFEGERQALALMEHPNIARVLDAGTTPWGHPFFVMELVRGVSLTQYCDRHRLAPIDRLNLFRQVCGAVQHAHQKGVIHRDLKPSNILVEDHDGAPVPKVIDFGLAKATSGLQLTEASLVTGFGAIAGTPLYMAPEQASAGALDVDTRADIYALGATLYELLTGTTPIRRESLGRASTDEVLRLIREEEPPAPSRRIASSAGLSDLAADRRVDPARLGRFVRGDLDWIVMKALDKDRERRYSSAAGLANDLERFLRHEPVTAGPPSTLYRTRKFIRRHRRQVIAAGLTLVALLAGSVGTTLGLWEARRQAGIARSEADQKKAALVAEADQRQRAEDRLAQVGKANAILGAVFQDLNPRGAKFEKEKPLAQLLAERLDRAAEQIREDSIGDELAVARMRVTLGESQSGLGHPHKAIPLLEAAGKTLAGRLGAEHLETLDCLVRLAGACKDAGQSPRAAELFEQVVRSYEVQLGPEHPETLSTLAGLAAVYKAMDRLDPAIKTLERVLATQVAKFGPDDEHSLTTANNLANAYLEAQEPGRAVALLEPVRSRLEAVLGADHYYTLLCCSNLARAYFQTGAEGRALPLQLRAFEASRATLGPRHPHTLLAQNNLATFYAESGHPDQALPLLEQGWAEEKAALGDEHPETLYTGANLAQVYEAVGRRDRAIMVYEQTLAGCKKQFGTDHAMTILTMETLGIYYMNQGRLAEALAILGECSAANQRHDGPESPSYCRNQILIGNVQAMARMWPEAERTFRRVLPLFERDQADSWRTSNVRSMLGGALLGQGRADEAGPLLLAGYAGLTEREATMPAGAKPRLLEALDRLVRWAEATHRPDEARQFREDHAWLEAGVGGAASTFGP